MFSLHEIGEKEIFDFNLLGGDAPFTQANFYGNWQRHSGRFVKSFSVSQDGEVVAYFQLIKFPLIFQKSCLYIPYGPVIKKYSDALLSFLKSELTNIAKNEHCVFVRLDFTPAISDNVASLLFRKAKSFTYHSAYFQPRTEWYLPIQKSADDLLMGMHEKTRYSIRLAQKKGIQTEIITKDFQNYFERFYALMKETADRNGFSLHAKEYYLSVFETLPDINGYLSIAKIGEQILVIDLIIVFSKTAHFVFGGSSNDARNLNPAALAHFSGITHAKELGAEYYNFGAVSLGTHKGWEGLTQFKMKFGGEIHQHSSFYDIVVNPIWYMVYTVRKFLKR